MATKWQKNNTTLSKNTVNFGQEANLQPMCEKSGSKLFFIWHVTHGLSA